MTPKGFLIPLALAVLLPLSASGAGLPFQSLQIQLEDHPQHGDGLAVITADTLGPGLTRLEVYAPGGRLVASYESKNKRNLGSRGLRLESPEPYFSDLLVSFPEGVYKFVGLTFEGTRLEGTYALKHHCLPAPQLAPPDDLPTLVPTPGRVIAWKVVEGATAYDLRVFEKGTGVELEVRVPAPATQFTIPAGWLRPGHDYQLQLGAVSDAGNVTFTHDTFTPFEF